MNDNQPVNPTNPDNDYLDGYQRGYLDCKERIMKPQPVAGCAPDTETCLESDQQSYHGGDDQDCLNGDDQGYLGADDE